MNYERLYNAKSLLSGSLIAKLPQEVIVEITSRCNLKCPGCARTARGPNRNIEMTQTQFEKLLDHLGQGVERLAFAGLGEPLLHPDIAKFIYMASSRGYQTVLYTNATLLDVYKLKELAEAGLYQLIIGFDGAFPESYEKFRYPAKYDAVLYNVRNAIEFARKNYFRGGVQIHMVKFEGLEKEVRVWKRLWPKAKNVILRIKDDHMGVLAVKNDNAFGVCPMLWRGPTTIEADGNILPCCVQSTPEAGIGNIFQHRLEDVWNGEKIKLMRALFLTNKRKQWWCKGCYIPLPSRLTSSIATLLPASTLRRLVPIYEFINQKFSAVMRLARSISLQNRESLTPDMYQDSAPPHKGNKGGRVGE